MSMYTAIHHTENIRRYEIQVEKHFQYIKIITIYTIPSYELYVGIKMPDDMMKKLCLWTLGYQSATVVHFLRVSTLWLLHGGH